MTRERSRGHPACEPTPTEPQADRVLSITQPIRHVVSSVKDAFTVVRPARINDLVADSITVDVQLTVPQGRDVDSRPLNSPREIDLGAELRRLRSEPGLIDPVD